MDQLLSVVCVLLHVYVVIGQGFHIPPYNVTVSCDNFETFVYWNYSHGILDPFFQVQLTSDISQSTDRFKSTVLQSNITHRLNNTNRAIYKVEIRAHNGSHQSNFSMPVYFTYDYQITKIDRRPLILCKLDFPAVNLTYQRGKVTLSFPNPIRMYENTPALKHLKHAVYPNLATSILNCEVAAETNILKDFECPYRNFSCKESVLILNESNSRYCIQLSGMIGDAHYLRHARSCLRLDLPLKSPVEIVFILIGCTTVVVIASVSVMVYRQKMSKTHPQPSTLQFTPKGGHLPDPGVDIISSISVDSIPLTPTSDTSQDPLLTSNRDHASCFYPLHTTHLDDWTQRNNSNQVGEDEEEAERPTEVTDWPSEVLPMDTSDDNRHELQILSQNDNSTGGTAKSEEDYTSRLISIEMAKGDDVDGYTWREPLA